MKLIEITAWIYKKEKNITYEEIFERLNFNTEMYAYDAYIELKNEGIFVYPSERNKTEYGFFIKLERLEKRDVLRVYACANEDCDISDAECAKKHIYPKKPSCANEEGDDAACSNKDIQGATSPMQLEITEDEKKWYLDANNLFTYTFNNMRK